MPPHTAKYTALSKIAALISSCVKTDEAVARALDIARDAAGVKALCLVCPDGANPRCWSSASEDSPPTNEFQTLALKAYKGSKIDPGYLVIPVSSGDGKCGVLVCDGTPPGDGHAGFLKAVGSQLALILENAKLKAAAAESEEYAEKRIREVATIYEIGQAIDKASVEDVLRMVTEKAAAVMDAHACSLVLRDNDTDQFVIEASYGLSDEIIKGTRITYGEGVAGTVAQTGEPMLLVDVASDPRLIGGHIVPRADISSSICVPLKDENGSVMGVLSIRRHVPSPHFNEEDLKLFSVFASQAALAISNAQLYSRLSQRIQEMSTVSDLLKAINSTLDLESVLNQIVDSIIDIVGFDRCCLYLMEPRTLELMASIKRGYDSTQIEEKVKLGEGVIGMAAKEQIPIFAEDPSSDFGPDNPYSEHVKSFLAVPVIVRDFCIGVVLVDNHITSRAISPANVELLSTFVSQAGIAIENARLYEAMEEKYSELNVLYEQSRAIGSAYGLENAAELLMSVTAKAVKSDAGVLILLNDRRTDLSVQVGMGLSDGQLRAVEEAIALWAAPEFVKRMRSPLTVTRGDKESFSADEWRILEPLISGDAMLLIAPLIAEDATIGVLILVRSKQSSFQFSEIKLLSIVVSHAAGVVKNAIRYEHRMRQKVLELSALYEFSKRISSASRLEDALDSILAIVSELVDNDECAIYAIEHERNAIVAKAMRSQSEAPNPPTEYALDSDNIVGWAIRERKALVSPDIQQDPRFEQGERDEQPVRSLMSIPLMVQDEVVGVLNVQSYRPNLYSEDDVRVLSIVASQGAAIYRELEALSALTSYTDNILSSIAAGVVTLDSDGMILYWNKAAETIVGQQGYEVRGLMFQNVIEQLDITAEEKERTLKAVRQVFETGETYQGYKISFNPVGREIIYLNMSISQLRNSAGERLGLVIIFEDVTKEIKMEDEFRRIGELAAVGQLAASIAHELRNPLSSIKGAAQLLKEQYEEEAMIVEFLEIIIDEVNGLSRLTTEFLDFARPMQIEPKPMDLNEVVGKTLQLMAVPISQAGVEVVQSLCPTLPKIEADDKQIEQVLKNVILNALQAMPEGGKLEITTRKLSGPAEYIELCVSDSGMGIPEDKLEKIFVPFFTTKTKGTGLGLAVVRKIIENHRGRIEVQSKLDQGTTFNVALPVSGAAPLPMTVVPVEELERRVSADFRRPTME